MASSHSPSTRGVNHESQGLADDVELTPLRQQPAPADSTTANATRQDLSPTDRGKPDMASESGLWPISKFKKRTAALRKHLTDSWVSEIGAAVLSAICLVAIVVVLKAFDGRPVPDLPDAVNLNAIVSILSTASRSSLMYAVSAAIGQAKWNWFVGRPKSLEDFEVLDEASRGPLGSIELLFGRTTTSIASIGALVTILTLAADPFVQQVITVSSDPIAGESDAAWTGKMTVPAQYFYDNTNQQANDVLDSINGAIWNHKSIYDRRAHCPTGNCTWDSFRSVEWCTESSGLLDLSNMEVNCPIAFNKSDFSTVYKAFQDYGTRSTESRNCEIRLPNAATSLSYPIQFSLEGGIGPLVTNPKAQEPDFVTELPLEFITPLHVFSGANTSSAIYLGVHNPVLAIGHARFSQSDITSNVVRIEAVEQSVLSLCLRNVNVTVQNGETFTDKHGDNYGQFYVDDTATEALGGAAWCWSPGVDVSAMKYDTTKLHGPNGDAFLVDYDTASFCTASDLSLGFDISRRLSSAVVAKRTNKSNGAPASGNLTTSYVQGAGISSEDILQRIASQSLANATDTIGASLNSLYYDDQAAETVRGRSVLYTAFTHVRWEWLILPIALETLGLLFLFIVLYRDRTRPVWKGSILAVLYHGLESDSSPMGRGLETASGMGEAAKATRVSLGFSRELERTVLR